MKARARTKTRPQVGLGTRIGGRYHITGLLGSGGMGSVYAGRDLMLDRAVAIKVLPPEKARDRLASRRFLREARAMARLALEGVVQVFDHGQDTEHGPYLVMEHLEGEDLSRVLHARGRFSLPLALAVVEQVCATLDAAHACGIVHRDLKPSNVFLLRHGGGASARVKVLDFGIARWVEDSAAVTQPGELLGTLGYMAPEQWSPGEPVDARADIYALGCMLYEMLAGVPPYRARTRAELEIAVRQDPPPSIARVRPDLPPIVDAALSRAMSKQPDQRWGSARAFARALGVTLPLTSAPDAGPGDAADYPGSRRYQVQGRLAPGRDTDVYVALDVERNRRVALKRLRNPGGEALLRLKREFRVASEIRHANVVRVDSLWEEGAHLVASMELVDGVPIGSYVAGSDERLRSCLGQLALALGALHGRGLAHRDVKPSNVLVDNSGRVVLLDCALSAGWSAMAAVEGTPSYVAPEVFEGRLGPEADLFSVGVMLRELLRDHVPVPADLAVLVERLCDTHPERRATLADILSLLAPVAHAATPPPGNGKAFVGREEALAALEQAAADAARGTPTAVWIDGASGIGKTALLRQFRQRLACAGGTLVFGSRARDGESIPFPALDEGIDELSSHLARLAPDVLEVLLPRRRGLLAHLFPVLARLPAVARADADADDAGDPARRRWLACQTLREMLRRICDQHPVVLLIDDIQWLDPDSAGLLHQLLSGVDPPPLLLVGARRTGDGMPGVDLRRVGSALASPPRTLVLGPLSTAESCTLVRSLWRGAEPLDDEVARHLARQSEGVPFLAEIAVSEPGAAIDPRDASLEVALRARLVRLPAVARTTLDVICTSSLPLRTDVALAASGASDHDEADALDPLFAASLIRSARAEGGRAVEPYHARITDIVRASMDPEVRRGHHRRLAQRLAQEPGTLAELLVEHLAGAGDARGAAAVAIRAAARANEQLAFDRAAALLGVALTHGQHDVAERIALERQQALALQNAGRRRDAGHLLLGTAALAQDAALRDVLLREAGTHLLLSGDVKLGLETLSPALARAGLAVPSGLGETSQATAAALGALAEHGMVPRDCGPPPPDLLDRIDLYLMVTQGLALIDMRSLPFACDALAAALGAGDPVRLQRAAALFVIDIVAYNMSPLVSSALDLCRRLTEQVRSPYARALLDTAEAECAHFAGDFLAAQAGFERAERALLESCPGATRELATARGIAVFIQYAQKGDFLSQVERTQRWLADAEATGDLFHAGMLRIAHAIVWIAHDQPERARAELHRAQADWTGQQPGALEVAAALYHDIVDRYEERDPQPGTGAARSPLMQNPSAHTPFLSGYLGLHTAWGAIRAVAAGRAPIEDDAAPQAIALLRGLGLALWIAVADALEANLDYLRGNRDAALRSLNDAELSFRQLYMPCLAACARKRRGQLARSALGDRLQTEADAELRALGVASPDRWARAYWSMFEIGPASVPTDVHDA
jgi:serine/threonine protein kinase